MMIAVTQSIPPLCPACFLERYQAPLLFIPERQPDTFEALPKRQPANVSKVGMVAQHFRQAIVGNPAAEVVHMVHSDICREPSEHPWQIIVRAAMQRRFMEAPAVVPRPVGPVELVLDVKEPDASRCAKEDNGQMDDDEGPEARRPGKQRTKNAYAQIGRHCAYPWRPAPSKRAIR